MDNEEAKPDDVSKHFETEHRYIDFSHTIVGVKVKKIDTIKSSKDLRFDDIFFSKYLLKC